MSHPDTLHNRKLRHPALHIYYKALMVEQLNNTAVPRPRTPSYATFSSAYAEAMTNILSDAATNGEVDDDYIQSELDTVAETFTEDYETYYAE